MFGKTQLRTRVQFDLRRGILGSLVDRIIDKRQPSLLCELRYRSVFWNCVSEDQM